MALHSLAPQGICEVPQWQGKALIGEGEAERCDDLPWRCIEKQGQSYDEPCAAKEMFRFELQWHSKEYQSFAMAWRCRAMAMHGKHSKQDKN